MKLLIFLAAIFGFIFLIIAFVFRIVRTIFGAFIPQSYKAQNKRQRDPDVIYQDGETVILKGEAKSDNYDN